MAGIGDQLDTDLPEQVEIILGRNQQGPVLHLLNRSGDRDQRFTAPTPITGGTVRLRVDGPVRAVEALRSGTSLPVTTIGPDQIEIQVPTLHDFEVVQVHLTDNA